MRESGVLIVEDNELQRRVLEKELKDTGFCPWSATSVKNARDLAREHGDDLDVVVLDMRLNWSDAVDDKGNDISGADLGRSINDEMNGYPPEFLIISSYRKEDYFQSAIKLGVAAYLHKLSESQLDTEEIVRHIRVLALRRTLNVACPETASWLQRVVTECREQREIIADFCREVLCRQLASTLGVPSAIILSNEEGSFCYSSDACSNAEGPDSAFSIIQDTVHQGLRHGEPFILDDLEKLGDSGDPALLLRFEGAAALPLTVEGNIRLSLCILPKQGEGQLSEDAHALACVLAEYFRPAVLAFLVRISAMCAELVNRAILSATSRACLYSGQEQVSLLSAVMEADPRVAGDPRLMRLMELAEDMRDIGERLGDILPDEEHAEAPERFEKVNLAELVRKAWDEVCQVHDIDTVLEVDGQAVVKGIREDLLFAVSKLLQWFADRMVMSGEESAPSARITCDALEKQGRLILQDSSPRLHSSLRERLFFPFSQKLPKLRLEKERSEKYPSEHMPLYLARILIELPNKGRLQDQTDDLSEEKGHRFLISLPLWKTGQV
jgi:CheY-like chemotaxis protein